MHASLCTTSVQQARLEGRGLWLRAADLLTLHLLVWHLYSLHLLPHLVPAEKQASLGLQLWLGPLAHGSQRSRGWFNSRSVFHLPHLCSEIGARTQIGAPGNSRGRGLKCKSQIQKPILPLGVKRPVILKAQKGPWQGRHGDSPFIQGRPHRGQTLQDSGTSTHCIGQWP